MRTRKDPRVVILGAGFGGLWAARSLAHTRTDVMLLDRNNYHTFLPLLYQVGAAELAPEDIAYPVRSILRKLPNVHFCLVDVQRVEFSSRTIATQGWRISLGALCQALQPGLCG